MPDGVEGRVGWQAGSQGWQAGKGGVAGKDVAWTWIFGVENFSSDRTDVGLMSVDRKFDVK